MDLNDVCSPILNSYIAKTFGSFDVEEAKATCHDCFCSKSCRGELPYYRSDLKCCTFHPFLPNYAVGALLESETVNAAIKKILIRKIQNREYALPMGIFVPVRYQVEFNHRKPEDFGNRVELLCPYFDKGLNQCGIWQYRGSVCTSYFCVSDRGEQGLSFWEELGDYLHVCEMVLAQDCIVSLGLSPESIDSQLEYINCQTGTNEELSSDSMSEALFNHHWQEWGSDHQEFYKACFKYVRSLNLKQMRELLADETQDLEANLKQLIAIVFKK